MGNFYGACPQTARNFEIRVSIIGAVQGLGVQTNYSGYINQATLSNSPQGLCGILLAAAEMEVQ